MKRDPFAEHSTCPRHALQIVSVGHLSLIKSAQFEDEAVRARRQADPMLSYILGVTRRRLESGFIEQESTSQRRDCLPNRKLKVESCQREDPQSSTVAHGIMAENSLRFQSSVCMDIAEFQQTEMAFLR